MEKTVCKAFASKMIVTRRIEARFMQQSDMYIYVRVYNNEKIQEVDEHDHQPTDDQNNIGDPGKLQDD